MSLDLPRLIDRFSSIILSVSVARFEQFGSSLRLRAIMQFTDGSRLGIRETVLGGTKRKYAYHWQDRNGNLIMRWDNAPDWDVKTYPHHKHVGEEKACLAQSLPASGGARRGEDQNIRTSED
jgi:hypothetical protein